jgi:hypothetical protein
MLPSDRASGGSATIGLFANSTFRAQYSHNNPSAVSAGTCLRATPAADCRSYTWQATCSADPDLFLVPSATLLPPTFAEPGVLTENTTTLTWTVPAGTVLTGRRFRVLVADNPDMEIVTVADVLTATSL